MTNTPQPVLYLDFDDVLNDEAWCGSEQRQRAIEAVAAAKHLTPFDAMRELAPLQDLRPEPAAHVKRILTRTGAQLIVCSSWRKDMSDDELRACLARVGLPFDGVVPRQQHKMSVYDFRQRDILAHVATLPPGTRWCVLDNDVREDHDSRFRRHVVTPKDGVTAEEADRVIRILTGIFAGSGHVPS